jgi:hypothetical protein
MTTDTFIHSGLASDPNNWSEGHIPGPTDNGVFEFGTGDFGIFDRGTMIMAGPPLPYQFGINLDVHGSPTLVMEGSQTANAYVSDGTLRLLMSGGSNFANVDDIGGPNGAPSGARITSTGDNKLEFFQNSPGTSKIHFAGTLDVSAVFEGGTTTITGSGALDAAYFSVGGIGGTTPIVNLNAPLTSGVATIDEGTLGVSEMRFLQAGGSVELGGSDTTLEIEHLPRIANVTLGDTTPTPFSISQDLTLDFQSGRSVSLSNVSVDLPQMYHAAQEPNGTLVLSDQMPVLPARSHILSVAIT